MDTNSRKPMLNPIAWEASDQTDDSYTKKAVCWNPLGPQRIAIDFATRTVQFDHCLQARSGLGLTAKQAVCSFNDICGCRDFFVKEHSGRLYRLLFALASLTGTPVSSRQMASCFISTTTGRGRIFADWKGFDDVRAALRQIAASSSHKRPATDAPWVGPLVAAIAILITAAVVWMML
ncbi:MAG TPA: hypothetical protein DIT89_03030 [Planctomycetaceae bacterium]|nr:hypothetical protein [Planctomycetaceae bacterium]